MNDSAFWGLTLIVGAIGFYLLPAIIATSRKHRSTAAIWALNILLGWSFIGWVAALVWALAGGSEVEVTGDSGWIVCHACPKTRPTNSERCPHCGAGKAAPEGRKKCPSCAEWIQGDAVKCRFCGLAVVSAGTSALLAAPDSAATAIDLRVLKVPAEIEQQILSRLRAGHDPDDVVLPGDWHAHDLRVVGESFPNPNGTSRQQFIDQAVPGTPVFLVPEPDNIHDPKAIRVFLSRGSEATAQIGYLPRGYDDVVADVEKARVAAWFASKNRADNGLWGATLYLVRAKA